MGLFFSSADEHNERGLKAYGLAEFSKALGHFRKAIDKDGRNDTYWWNYAHACAALGDSTGAIAALETCARLGGPYAQQAQQALASADQEPGFLEEFVGGFVNGFLRAFFS